MKFRVVATVVSTGGSVTRESIEEFDSLLEADRVCEQMSNWDCYYLAYPLKENGSVD